MDECLAVLSGQPEHSGDTILATLVKIQLIIAEVTYSHCTWPFGNSSYTSKAQIVSKPYLHSLLSQLAKIKDEVPPELADCGRYGCVKSFSHKLTDS